MVVITNRDGSKLVSGRRGPRDAGQSQELESPLGHPRVLRPEVNGTPRQAPWRIFVPRPGDIGLSPRGYRRISRRCAFHCDQRETSITGHWADTLSGDPDDKRSWSLHLRPARHPKHMQLDPVRRAGVDVIVCGTRIGPGSRLFAGAPISIREALGPRPFQLARSPVATLDLTPSGLYASIQHLGGGKLRGVSSTEAERNLEVGR